MIQKLSCKNGFTLIEALIIAGLLGVLVTTFASYQYQRSKQNKFQEVRAEYAQLQGNLKNSIGQSESLSQTEEQEFSHLASPTPTTAPTASPTPENVPTFCPNGCTYNAAQNNCQVNNVNCYATNTCVPGCTIPAILTSTSTTTATTTGTTTGFTTSTGTTTGGTTAGTSTAGTSTAGTSTGSSCVPASAAQCNFYAATHSVSFMPGYQNGILLTNGTYIGTVSYGFPGGSYTCSGMSPFGVPADRTGCECEAEACYTPETYSCSGPCGDERIDVTVNCRPRSCSP